MKLALISDIHEDRVRLALALERLERSNVDLVACLGDIVGFDVKNYNYLSSRDASWCIDCVKANCRWIIAGNHDLYAIRKVPQICGPFQYPDNWYGLDFIERKALAKERVWLYEHRELPPLLTRADRNYLDSLPLSLQAEIDGHRMIFSHSLFPDLSGSLAMRPTDPWHFKSHLGWMRENGASYGFSGHLHLNGMGLASSTDYELHRFKRKIQLTAHTHHICPCLASSSSRNGYLLLDTQTGEVRTEPLRSKPYLMHCFQ